MTAFVESCAKTVTGSAAAVARGSRGRPRIRQLLRFLADKKKILITTHTYPDPDALASCLALESLLRLKLASSVEVRVSFKGGFGGGLNEQFAKLTEIAPLPWDESTLKTWDAIHCLVGPQDADFDKTNTNPCAQQGKGAFPDESDAEIKTKLQNAMSAAADGIASKDVATAKKNAATVESLLNTIK